jgi:hypothetical protein
MEEFPHSANAVAEEYDLPTTDDTTSDLVDV